ncbi:MAG: 6-pyruvoyl-tetrahydropterin synthase-related protein [Ruminococcus flavefaciens]|nr:6-pyruvoyl-tetrahydropterin synthase-related protein [Ruminococcus flavefaciens]
MFFKLRKLLVVEACLLLLAMITLFGKNNLYEYGLEDMTVHFGNYSEQPDGIYVDAESGMTGNAVDFENIVLKPGVYIVRLLYTTDVDGLNRCVAADNTLNYKSLFTNGSALYAGLSETNYEMWLLQSCKNLSVHVEYAGEGTMIVKGLQIQQTNALNRIFVFLLTVFFVLIDGVYLFLQYDRQQGVSLKNRRIIFGLAMIVLTASYPIMVDYMPASSDLVYHLMRIEGIKDGILMGQFPVRISPRWLQDYGYASPIFYGELFLYIAAVFRLIGFSVLTSYRLFVVLMIIGTALISYYCFKKIFGDAYVGLFCSLLYTLSSHRICKLFIRGYIGEGLGTMLLPIVLYGMYKIYTQEIQDKNYRKSWLTLAIGLALILQNHLLTCELACGFVVFTCLVLWKRTFRKETFLVLLKAALGSIVFSAWWLIPFLDYMLTGNFVIHNVSARKIQFMGLELAHLFKTFGFSGDNMFYGETGMKNTAPMGEGIALLAPLLFFAYLLFTNATKKLSDKELAFGKFMAGIAVLSMFMSLNIFPWDALQSMNRVTAVLISSLQYPERFLNISTVCLVAVAGVAAKQIRLQKNNLLSFAYAGGGNSFDPCEQYLSDE